MVVLAPPALPRPAERGEWVAGQAAVPVQLARWSEPPGALHRSA